MINICFLVINVTLPDEKSNYVHRIGRVGRAERMGLAISLVSSVPEKVCTHLICLLINYLFNVNLRCGTMVNGVNLEEEIVGIHT